MPSLRGGENHPSWQAALKAVGLEEKGGRATSGVTETAFTHPRYSQRAACRIA